MVLGCERLPLSNPFADIKCLSVPEKSQPGPALRETAAGSSSGDNALKGCRNIISAKSSEKWKTKL
jgi:hypothetical protein